MKNRLAGMRGSQPICSAESSAQTSSSLSNRRNANFDGVHRLHAIKKHKDFSADEAFGSIF